MCRMVLYPIRSVLQVKKRSSPLRRCSPIYPGNVPFFNSAVRRNPRGFRSREKGWQELVLMRLALAE